MSDPHAKRWLADDPNFLANLGDLDLGLTEGGAVDASDELMPSEPPPAVAAAKPPPSPDASASTPAGSAVARAPQRAVVAAAEPPHAARNVDRSNAGRPLIDLFPESALEPERPPMPALGTAVGPQLPPTRPRPAPSPPTDEASPLTAPTYEMFYGLREKAFSQSTDPRFLYQSASHDRAGQGLLSAFRKRSGVTVLTGPIGAGKTTLCRSVVSEIDRRTVTSLVLEPPFAIDDLLKIMLVDFGVISREDLARAPQVAHDVLTGTLHSFLESLVSLQAGAALIIDEAQNLPVALLSDLTAIVDAGPEGRLQIVLVGQPGLTSLLKQPELRPLNVTVTRRLELGPLGADEIASYVRHRLSVAGDYSRVDFSDEAVALLYKRSGGLPRVVNLLCDHALTRGQQSSASVIDGALIAAAAADLDLDAPSGEDRGPLATLSLAAAFALLVLVGAAAGLWVSRDAVERTILQWENVPAAPGGPIRLLPVPLAPIPPPQIVVDERREKLK